MKGLISYSSKTGNTKRVAETLYDALSEDFDVELKEVRDVKDPSAYDFILHGIWVRMTDLDILSKRFLKKIPEGTRVGIFGTSGGEHATEHSGRLDGHLEDAVEGFDVIGVKLNYGKVDEKLIGKIDGIIGTLLPKKTKEYIKEMSKRSRPATEEELQETADYFKERI